MGKIPTGTWPTLENSKQLYLKFRLGTYSTHPALEDLINMDHRCQFSVTQFITQGRGLPFLPLPLHQNRGLQGLHLLSTTSLRPSQRDYVCLQSEFQNLSFFILRRKPCCCRYFTTVFAIFSVAVTVTVLTYLCVISHHFCCPVSLFQGHVACWNYTLTCPPPCRDVWILCFFCWSQK